MIEVSVIFVGAGVFMALCIFVIQRQIRRRRWLAILDQVIEDHARAKAAREREFIACAEVWHGYEPSSKEGRYELPKLYPEYLVEDIPRALHAQHRIAGEERLRGRKGN